MIRRAIVLLAGGLLLVTVLEATAGASPTPLTSMLPSPQLAGRGSSAVCSSDVGCLARLLTVKPGSDVPVTSHAPLGYGPQALSTAYQLPSAATGNAGTEAIIDSFYDPNAAADLAAYRSTYKLPRCTMGNGCFRQVNALGTKQFFQPTTPAQDRLAREVGVETSLDLDMASAACPTCSLILVYAYEPGSKNPSGFHVPWFADAVSTAVRLGADSVSVSYQFPPIPTFLKLAPSFNHPGVAVLASSGDGGYEGDHVGFPADLPTVISVGGTTLYQTPGQGDGFTEVAWDDGGSGCAVGEPPAVGQPDSVSGLCGGFRAGADISAVADPTTGVAVYDSYTPPHAPPFPWFVVGGTSVSSPYVGGLFARAGTAGVNGPSTLYANAGDFRDITLGQNAPFGACFPNPVALCQASIGWDGPTGVGTPQGLTGF